MPLALISLVYGYDASFQDPMISRHSKAALTLIHAGLLLWLIFLAGTFFFFYGTIRAAEPIPRIFKYEEVDSKPSVIQMPRIRYSRAERKEHSEITLRFVVTAIGKVSQLTVVKFSDPDLIDPAYSAYEAAEFSPGIKAGKPVDTWMQITEVAK
jgi:hypothetical protein